MNRVFIADLPGITLPAEVRGKTAYDLVSTAALERLIRQHRAQLQINADVEGHPLHLAYERCLKSDVPSVRTAAEAIARLMGRYLGYVLLTVKRGDAINRQTRPEWGFSQWEHWAGIERVWLGGGLASGNLGPPLAHHAAAVMHEGGKQEFTIQVSPFAAHLPLVGAARHIPRGVRQAVTLDFGSSWIKRARAIFDDDRLTELHPLPSQPVPWAAVGALNEASPGQAEALLDGMAATIARTWQTLNGASLSQTIPVSLAAYIRDGHTLVAQGGVYQQADLITDNLERELARRVSARVKAAIRVKLLHDGTAAATAYAGQDRTAVIMIGTALGIGFPGAQGDLRKISNTLKITPAANRS